MSHEGGNFFTYLALLIGTGLLGAYFWFILITITTYSVFHYLMLISGVLLLASSFSFVYTKNRTSRVILTALSGMLGGTHFLLIMSIFEAIIGVILFAWVAFGILLAFAAFNWSLE